MKFVLVSIGLMVVMFINDMCWTLWTRRSNEGKAHIAAFYSVLIYLFGLISFFQVFENRWYLIPVAMGAYAGTYYAVKKDHPSPDSSTG